MISFIRCFIVGKAIVIIVVTMVTSEAEILAGKRHEDMFWYGRNYLCFSEGGSCLGQNSLRLTSIIHTFVYVNQNNF